MSSEKFSLEELKLRIYKKDSEILKQYPRSDGTYKITIKNGNVKNWKENSAESFYSYPLEEFNIEIFYINLDRRTDRKEIMEKQLNKLKDIKYQRFSAIDKQKMDFLKYLNQGIIDKDNYIKLFKNKKVYGEYLTLGGLGCFLSHIELWKISAEKNKFLVILEDDVILSENFEEELKFIFYNNISFDILYLSQSSNNYMGTAVEYEKVYKIRDNYWGTYGYIINPNYAKKLISQEIFIDKQIDSWLQQINNKNYADVSVLKKFLLTTDAKENRDSDCQIYSEKKMKIPKIIHQIWVGPNPIPEKYKEYMNTWKRDYPDWEILLWTDKEVSELELINQDLYDQSSKYAQKADILRYELIYNIGGFYIDCDFESLKNMEEILSDFEFISSYEHFSHRFIANGFFGSIPKHPLLANIIDNLKNNYNENIEKPINYQTGPIYFTKEINKFQNSPDNNTLHIFENFILYPYYWNENLPNKYYNYTYAVHHWGSSWN